jgi:trehalose-phosphatase
MKHLPPPWVGSAEAAALGRRFRAGIRSLLMLDYDGTLAPFHTDRFQAVPYPGVTARLQTLSQLAQVRLVLVSGRSARELSQLLGIRVEIWGSHGREHLSPHGAYKHFALDPVERAALDEVERKLSELGWARTLEVKPSSIAVHWRSADTATQERIRSTVTSVFAGLGRTGSLELLPFDGGAELRSTDRTKGTAVREILTEESAATPAAYLGDDLTDEDAFAALGNGGYSVLVRSEVRESVARFWLRPPAELLHFLDNWIRGAS